MQSTLPPSTHKEKSLFLSFSVTDTGRGLTPNELALLFQRFTQATPETHIYHGGSGLGLFICRKLTELQGGQITVQSRRGEGSTFSFYIETRRSQGPETEDNDATVVAAKELTKSRTEATFLQSRMIRRESEGSQESSPARSRIAYSVLIVEVCRCT
jgi:hypothetical protein